MKDGGIAAVAHQPIDPALLEPLVVGMEAVEAVNDIGCEVADLPLRIHHALGSGARTATDLLVDLDESVQLGLNDLRVTNLAVKDFLPLDLLPLLGHEAIEGQTSDNGDSIDEDATFLVLLRSAEADTPDSRRTIVKTYARCEEYVVGVGHQRRRVILERMHTLTDRKRRSILEIVKGANCLLLRGVAVTNDGHDIVGHVILLVVAERAEEDAVMVSKGVGEVALQSSDTLKAILEPRLAIGDPLNDGRGRRALVD